MLLSVMWCLLAHSMSVPFTYAGHFILSVCPISALMEQIHVIDQGKVSVSLQSSRSEGETETQNTTRRVEEDSQRHSVIVNGLPDAVQAKSRLVLVEKMGPR